MRLILFIFSIFLFFGYSLNENMDKKFCDKSLPDSKIKEFETCEKFVPKEILDNSNACLKQMKLEPTYRSFRNTMCTSNLRRKYVSCHRNLMRQQKTESTTEISQDKIEMFRNHEVCMRKAMGIKDNPQN